MSETRDEELTDAELAQKYIGRISPANRERLVERLMQKQSWLNRQGSIRADKGCHTVEA